MQNSVRQAHMPTSAATESPKGREEEEEREGSSSGKDGVKE